MVRVVTDLLEHQPKDRLFELTFTDPEMGGLVASVRLPPLGRRLVLSRIASLPRGEITPEQVEVLFRAMADCLVSWNLPVPPDLEGLYSLETEAAAWLVAAWLAVATDIESFGVAH